MKKEEHPLFEFGKEKLRHLLSLNHPNRGMESLGNMTIWIRFNHSDGTFMDTEPLTITKEDLE
jgi:hypothetical protein